MRPPSARPLARSEVRLLADRPLRALRSLARSLIASQILAERQEQSGRLHCPARDTAPGWRWRPHGTASGPTLLGCSFVAAAAAAAKLGERNLLCAWLAPASERPGEGSSR